MAVELPVALIGFEPNWKTVALRIALSVSAHKKKRGPVRGSHHWGVNSPVSQ
jgi:hypothetical protein